ncbi:MAG: cadmium-translocating P-type ATPase [Methanosphaera sp.]|nr:cadmium-translocating P-type ATPase [Methanosphaera sp.]
MVNTNQHNECFDPDCEMADCHNPEHYEYICMDPTCDQKHCENHAHYNKKLLKDFQEHTDFTVFSHKDVKIDKNTKVSLCNCDDCQDDDDCCDDECECHTEEHHHHNHEHNHHHHEHHNHHEHDDTDCCCDDECESGNVILCNCEDCQDDDEEEEEVIKEGVPLLANRSIQIIVSSGILFALGHIIQHFYGLGIPAIVVFGLGAIISGYDIAIMAVKALKKYNITPSVLVVIAAIASFLIGHPEEGAAVTFLYFISEFLEDYSEQRAQHSIKSLVEIAPETACVKIDGSEVVKSVDDVAIGETVIVKPGDKIPLDGKIVKGISSINQASITGESVPVTKTVDDEVFSGTVNSEGYLEIEVTKQAKDSVISKIVDLVKSSQLNRSHTETYVEKISKYYTPLMVVITICIAFIPPLFFGESLIDWVYRALSIMVISCPCAFLISTPVGMVSAITSATRKGVLIKGSNYVEEMRNIKAVILDKTGTLTEGKLEVKDIQLISSNYSQEDLIRIASSLETKSSHPIGAAITNYAHESNITYHDINNFKNVPGKGVVGLINNKEYYAANESLIDGGNFNVSHEDVMRYASDGKTVIFVGCKEEVIGIITVRDKIRDESSEVINNLKNNGIKTIMLTGDNKVAAYTVGEKIGVDYVFSDLLPEDKLDLLDMIRNKFGDVAMVGDGVNDAPSLARANIGIAMGAVGSDVAIETADVALMQDDLTKLPYLFDLSKKTMQVISQNIVVALGVKFLFVILAILGLITLMMAVGIGDLGLTLLVILNSLRIGIVKDPLF